MIDQPFNKSSKFESLCKNQWENNKPKPNPKEVFFFFFQLFIYK